MTTIRIAEIVSPLEALFWKCLTNETIPKILMDAIITVILKESIAMPSAA